MGEKVKLNKSELTRLKREEKTYNQFLPVLKLKQEQLQIEQIKAKRNLREALVALQAVEGTVSTYLPLLCESLTFDLNRLLKPSEIITDSRSVAGVMVKVFKSIEFSSFKPDFFGNPMWVGLGLKKMKGVVEAKIRHRIIEIQYEAISKELRKATQKVNLFEKVLIPETVSAIKRIKIALGDEQVAQVVRGKIAKMKSIAALEASA